MMEDSACLIHAFSYASAIPNEIKQGNPVHALGESISFGRFVSESLDWEKWSTFSHKRYVEEAERYAKPGSVAQKKAFFEAHYKKIAAQKAAALLEQANQENPNSEITKNSAPDSTSLVKPRVEANQEEVHENPDAVTTDSMVKDAVSVAEGVADAEERESESPVEGPGTPEALVFPVQFQVFHSLPKQITITNFIHSFFFEDRRKSTLKEKAGTELRKLGQSFCFKARPLPDFYKETETAKDHAKKIPVTQAQVPPKRGRMPYPSSKQGLISKPFFIFDEE